MNRKYRVYLPLLIVLLFLISCSSSVTQSDEVREVAKEVEVIKEVPVTRVVESIREVEVAREVIVTREFAAEVVVADASDEAMAESASSTENRVQLQPTLVPSEPVPIIPQQISPPSGDQFEETDVNPFTLTIDDHLSTFAIDVDTGSYTLMRNYLSDHGSMPPPDSVRVEEYINFFDQEYARPTEGAFAINLDAAPSPYADNDKYDLLRVGIQGYEVPEDERPPVLLIFVIDTSGSMMPYNRLGLVKDALELLVGELRADDRIGIVEFGSNAETILTPTSLSDRYEILDAIDRLHTGGSTNAEEGIANGYRMANRYRLDGEVTRLLVLSDGGANVGRTTSDAILEHARRGISLSTFGFGMGGYNDVLMEQLADDGDGSYGYIDTLREAQRVFVKNLSGTLLTIAKDAKIQVDFNPEVVEQYRLIGYENRDVADQDFRNDNVDAGEIGSGHSVTALYEVRLKQEYDAEETALTVHVRYEDPDTGVIKEIARSLAPNQFMARFSDAPATFQLSAVVAEYAELLKDSYWAQNSDLTSVWQDAQAIGRLFPRNSDIAEFIDLVGSAAAYSD